MDVVLLGMVWTDDDANLPCLTRDPGCKHAGPMAEQGSLCGERWCHRRVLCTLPAGWYEGTPHTLEDHSSSSAAAAVTPTTGGAAHTTHIRHPWSASCLMGALLQPTPQEELSRALRASHPPYTPSVRVGGRLGELGNGKISSALVLQLGLLWTTRSHSFVELPHPSVLVCSESSFHIFLPSEQGTQALCVHTKA